MDIAMKKNCLHVILISMVMLLLLPAAPVFGSSTSLVAVTATGQTDYNVGDLVQIDVKALNAENLYGVQFILDYDPLKLEVVQDLVDGVLEDRIHIDSSFTLWDGDIVNKVDGILGYPLTYNELPGANGEVPIASFTFRVLESGATTVWLDQILVVNSDPSPQPIHTSTQYQLPLNFTSASVVSVSMDRQEVWLDMADHTMETVSATVYSEYASNRNVIWTSSNAEVATVNSSGMITAVGPGMATITVTTEVGGHTDTCIVKVGTILTLEWHTGATSADTLSYIEVSAVSSEGVQHELTNAEGKAIFTGLSEGNWSFLVSGEGYSEVVQASPASVELTPDNQTSSAVLRVVPLEDPATSGDEIFNISDILHLTQGMSQYDWDFNQDTLSDAEDIRYLLQKIKPLTYNNLY
jgi:hypothetical protein